jgi:hypothetical protein
MPEADMATVSGGAGAVGTVVGIAILESGGDVVFVDVSDPIPETWSMHTHDFAIIILFIIVIRLYPAYCSCQRYHCNIPTCRRPGRTRRHISL